MNIYTCIRTLSKVSCVGRISFRAQQCRSIYLMSETFGPNPPREGSEIGNIVPFKGLTPADQCFFDLNITRPEEIRRRMNLDEVMAANVKPGWLLCPKNPSEVHEAPQYRMKHISTPKLQTAALRRVGKASMVSRIFRLSTKTSLHTFVELMALMWYQLENRQAVEVQLQWHMSVYSKHKVQGVNPFKRVFDTNFHLRPDVILKAMPAKCGIIIDPQTNNAGVVCWAIGPPYTSKNGRVFPPNNHTQKLYEKREVLLKRRREIKKEALEEVGEFIDGVKDHISHELLSGSPEASDAFRIALLQKKVQRKEIKRALKERAQLREKTRKDIPKWLVQLRETPSKPSFRKIRY